MNSLHLHNPEDKNSEIYLKYQNFSDGINYFKEKNLKPYTTNTINGKITIFVNSYTNQIEYAFNIGKNITHIPLFQLGTLKAQWNGKNKKSIFHNAILNKQENIAKFNTAISQFEKNKLNKKEKKAKNPHFPNGTYIYTNQYGKEFTVIIQDGIAINIITNSGLVFPGQKAAITRAINENKLDKFEKVISTSSTQLKVVKKANKILEGEYLGKEVNLSKTSDTILPEDIRSKIKDSTNLLLSKNKLDTILGDVETFSIMQTSLTREQINAAREYIRIMRNRTETTNEDLIYALNNRKTLDIIFDNITNNIAREGYNIGFIEEMYNLADKVKMIFLAQIVQDEKKAYH